MPDEPSFHIDVEGMFDFTVEELWPDGDAPEHPTLADAVKLVRDAIGGMGTGIGMDQGLFQFLQEWDLVPTLTVYDDQGNKEVIIQ